MYNIYSSSTVGIRSKGSLCLSINDYYSSNEKCPSSLCLPCSCCSISIYGYGVPIVNTKYLYGFRQSSLIHCSASRKLILGGGGGCSDRYRRLQDCNSDLVCNGGSYYSLKESSRQKERERGIARRGRRIICMGWEEKSESFDCSDGNVEAMLSLLTEDIGESILDAEWRKNRSRTVDLQGERRSRVSECVNEGNKYVDSGSSEGYSKCNCQSVKNNSREEGRQHFGGMKSSFKKVDNGGVRKERLIRSSCYSEGLPMKSKRELRDVNECVKEENKYIECGSSERNSTRESESVKIKLREEGSLRGEHLNSRKERSSSTSSNWSRRCPKDTKNINVGECTKEERKYVESGSLGKISNCEYGAATNKSREEGCRSTGEMGVFTRGGNQGLRKEGSSCSSYYSAASSGDIDEIHGSNTVSQVEHERFVGEPSSNYKFEESRKTDEGLFTDDVKKKCMKYESDGRTYEEASRKGRTLVGRDETSIRIDGALRNDEHKIMEVKDRASRSQERSDSRDNNSIQSIDFVENTRNERSRKGHQAVQQSRFQEQSQISDIQNRVNRSSYSSQNTLSEREEKITEAVNLVVEARERNTRVDNQIIGLSESTGKSQQVSQISGIHGSDTRWSSGSQRVHETNTKNREENSSSLEGSFQEAKEQRTQADQEVVEVTKSDYESHDATNVSVISAFDAELFSSSQKLQVTRMSTQEENSTSHVDMALEAREGNQTGQRVTGQVWSVKESQRPSRTSGFRESSNEEGSSSQTALDLVHHAGEQEIGTQKVDRRNLQVMVTPPSSQLVGRHSTETLLNQRPSNHSAIREDPPQEEVPASRQELDGGTSTNEIYAGHSNLVINDDVLVSANRLEASSTMFVGEFMEKLRGETSTSEFVEGRTSSQSNQQVSEDFQSQVDSSRRSSFLSGRKGPSDEMWHVSGSSKIEAPIEAKSMKENTIVRSTNRSLWGVVSDIVRLRWGARSETHNSTNKSGGRSSPNESGVSEARFSSNEPDENDDENAKKSKRGTPKRSRSSDLPHPRKPPTQTQGDTYEVMVPHENLMEGEAYTTSSSIGRGSASQVVSSASNEDRLNLEGVKTGQVTPPSIKAADSSVPLLKRRLIRSPPVEAKMLESNIEVSTSGSKETADEQLSEKPTKAMETGRKDGDSKQKKFERNKQVLKDRFEEWEEAYIIESEQKKMDEMFMREALMEAKKAADTWEVPVGAVLVHNGKIIARGCNLVEELRDSTAHAEMICIREASNVLRTWRLAETTLYVTLEPCAMCAGAILQARVDTVVWGAPNKLLGADGSWVRLFPTGSEGKISSDLTNQLTGPVHPFHPKMTIRRGILSTECADIMQQFFQLRRRTKEKKSDSPPPPPPPSYLTISGHPSKIITKMHDVFHIMFCL
ncbi:hypothetical protein C5167_033441 [Papaver somniferum]|uniref:tRNA(adenine(34)) deaminase n=1 Tax=Papaver somniferum TaxID=3469 RepID=A0A4Y7KEI6_PAPSO|nr:tRNA(adenine(34)) deaminase, chloroplastic-like [Papaver somniferum]RZC70325.1 hypothetical protein C5167_033441 [Papaver somniferum]